MKDYARKPENTSHTIQSNSKASRQAPIGEILQAYKDRIEGKPVQRQSVDDDELLQAKAAQQDHIKAVLQQYKERNIQRYTPEEDEELMQGKFDTAQRETIDEDELLQGKFESTPTTEQEPVQREEKPNNTGLPDNLKTRIENLSGYSMDDVKVHYNSDKPAQLNALAYAQGTDIHVAPGQEKHLPHEAWHVVQQKQGRVQPTMQLQGMNVNDNEGLEKEADRFFKENFNQKHDIVQKKSESNVVQRFDTNVYELQITETTTDIKTGEETLTGVNSVGHIFKLALKGKDAKGCKLRWYEKTNKSYLPPKTMEIYNESFIVSEKETYMKEGIWNNMYELSPNSKVFRPWNSIKSSSGDYDIIIEDIPGLVYNNTESMTRTLEFRIILEGRDGTEKIVMARQDIEINNGSIIKNNFTIFSNNVTTSPSGFVDKDSPIWI